MKKLVKAAFVVIPCLLALNTYASPFNGFYGGFGLSALNTIMKTNWTAQAVGTDTVSFNGSENHSEWNPVVNIILGYGKSFGKNYAGLEGGFVSETKTMDTYDTTQTDVGGNSFNYHNQSSLSEQLSLGLKLGRLLSPNDLIFISPGISYASFYAMQEIVNVNAGTTSILTSGTSMIWGHQLSIGYDHAFNDNFALQAEATAVQYQSESYTGSNTSNFSGSTTFKPYQYQLNFSAIYKF
ncbi:MAG: hypothetical protein Q7V63_06995 [Gammaproteobacteria bacterium]|nr:hypothetical protein [Gammaproteobacteria bacterium]